VNIKEYIASGIVESYVLGLASEEERAEFEEHCRQYPELVAARNAFEEALEKEALAGALTAPPQAKNDFLQFIQETGLPSPVKDVPLPTNPPMPKAGTGVKWLAAASVILFIVTSYFAYRFYDQNKTLQDTNQQLQAKLKSTDSVLNKIAQEQRLMSDPNVSVVNMTGTEKAPQSSASIYWDSTSANVWLIVKNMPKLPSDKQYQLWALIDGKPKDLGLFDPPAEGKVMLKMNNTQRADAFAITIENRGNTGGPTLEQLQTIGKTRL
jgi:anti-sigma-K factor RskA